MTDNEILLAISDMLDTKLKPIKEDIQTINMIIENEIQPDIKLLTENYLPSARRYEKATNKIEAIQSDIDIIKKVVAEHSEKLQKIS